jgi:hypothetical protein
VKFIGNPFPPVQPTIASPSFSFVPSLRTKTAEEVDVQVAGPVFAMTENVWVTVAAAK